MYGNHNGSNLKWGIIKQENGDTRESIGNVKKAGTGLTIYWIYTIEINLNFKPI